MPAVIVAAVVPIVAISGVAIFMALRNPASSPPPSRHAMAETALKGIEAVIIGDTDTLAALSDATMTAQITPDFASKLQMSGIVAEFSDPKWNGDNFEVLISTGKGDGILLGGPVPDGSNVVLYRTMGMIAATTGGVTLTPSGSGWLISQFVAGKSASATGSVSPTSTPSTSSTP
jgi:hypothetical protein